MTKEKNHMKNDINKILNDLYMIDPKLKKQEKEIKKIIQEIIKEKPNTKFDKNFAYELRIKIMNKAEELKNKKNSNIFNFIFMKKTYYVFGGVAVIALVIVTSLSLNKIENKNIAFDNSNFTRLGPEAFGSLSGLDQGNQNLNAEESMLKADGLGSAVGAGGQNTAPLTTSSRNVEEKMIMPPYYGTKYEYEYIGEDFSVNQEKMEVYKRIKNLPNENSLNSLINNIDLDLLDISAFKDSKLQNLNFVEDRNFGFMVSLNPSEGMVSISQNWQKWPNPFQNCREQSCYENARLKISQVPSDEEIIKIADNFIKEYGIDISLYENGQVDKRWEETYSHAENLETAYVPDSISVIYQLKINGKDIYDNGGNPDGIRVNVDIRNKKVSGAWNITSNSYQSSEYQVEQDVNRILDLAKKGGQNIYYNNQAEKTVTIKIGNPELIYVKHYKYENNQTEELLIPALKFPIIEKPEDSYLSYNQIIVPIIKDILDERINDPGVLPRPIEPLLLEESAAKEIDQ